MRIKKAAREKNRHTVSFLKKEKNEMRRTKHMTNECNSVDEREQNKDRLHVHAEHWRKREDERKKKD